MPKRPRNEGEAAAESSSDDDIGPSLPPPPGPSQAPAAQPAPPPPPPPATVRTVPATAEQLRVCAEALPSSLYYERSYLHREVVTHLAVAPVTDFLLTASADGCLKFWRKTAGGILFVKVYRAHLGEIAALAVSHDGARAATAGDDGTLKLFDVPSFDMQTMAKLAFLPSGAAAWCYPPGAPLHALALADRHAPLIHVLDGDTGAPLPWGRITLHTSPVLALAYSPARDALLSADARGVIECWSACPERALQPPPGVLTYASKLDTDLYALARAKLAPCALAFHPRGTHFVATASDGAARVFALSSGKCLAVYGAEDGGSAATAAAVARLQLGGAGEVARRRGVEAEVEAAAAEARRALLAAPVAEGPQRPAPGAAVGEGSSSSSSALAGGPRPPPATAIFDHSGHFLLLPTLLGVKVICLDTGGVTALLGACERERFLALALFQGVPSSANSQVTAAATAAGGGGGGGGGGPSASAAASSGSAFVSSAAAAAAQADPTLFALAYGRPRVYCISTRDPPGAGAGAGAREGVGEGEGEEEGGEKDPAASAGAMERLFASRDCMNEPPHRNDPAAVALQRASGGRGGGGGGGGGGERSKAALPSSTGAAGTAVCLATSLGEVWLQLFPGDAPLACENFTALCKRGYYDRVEFFRCIKGFMVQTGDPSNSGMGGESMWGKEFEDEIVGNRRFAAEGVLAMANAGPRTNGSQFFITTAAARHLDGKHTIFGRVTQGLEVIERISSLKCDKKDRPIGDVPRILSVRFG